MAAGLTSETRGLTVKMGDCWSSVLIDSGEQGLSPPNCATTDSTKTLLDLSCCSAWLVASSAVAVAREISSEDRLASALRTISVRSCTSCPNWLRTSLVGDKLELPRGDGEEDACLITAGSIVKEGEEKMLSLFF